MVGGVSGCQGLVSPNGPPSPRLAPGGFYEGGGFLAQMLGGAEYLVSDQWPRILVRAPGRGGRVAAGRG
jgi:hypothetical protein